jgi:hypothetical protein
MNSEFISKGHDPQETPTELGHSRPEAKAAVLLRLAPNRIQNDPNTHLLADVRPPRGDIVFEVLCEPKIPH